MPMLPLDVAAEETPLLSSANQQEDRCDDCSNQSSSDSQDPNIHGLLYTSHILSTWNSRQFEFGAFLFLASIYPNTLLPASIYALARSASAVLLSPWIGRRIDRNGRLSVVRLSIVGQRLAVALSCAVFGLLMYRPVLREKGNSSMGSLLVLSLLACLEKTASVANTISVERDWVVVIANGDEQHLGQLNSQMRRIDLFCKLAAPLAISIVDSYSTTIAVAVTGVVSTASIFVEYFAIARVYAAVPALQTATETLQAPSDDPLSVQAHDASDMLHSTASSLKTYLTSSVVLPSIALSLLYLTVLSFNGQLVTYLLALGLPATLITILRGVAAILELSATWLAPQVISRIGSVRAGIWFINWQILCVSLAAAFLWSSKDPDAKFDSGSGTIPFLAGMIACIIFSRLGLWGFDLSAQMTIQSSVPTSQRGSFSAWESSLQNAFEMLSFVSTIVWSAPAQFKYPVAVSTVAVGIAGVVYATFVRERRGHLIHLSKCVERHKSATGAGDISRVQDERGLEAGHD